MHTLLVINPGSTSTKVALYRDESQVFLKNIAHSREELARFDTILEQYPLRQKAVLDALAESGVGAEELSAIMSRGGMLSPVAAGAYEINDVMLEQLRTCPAGQHAANVGAFVAHDLAASLGIKAYVYDPISVDEMLPLARVTGIPGIVRRGFGHNLNMRASAIRYAKERNLAYAACTLIVAHLGGGSTLSLHKEGRIIDMVSDDEGPFAPERAGELPAMQMVDLVLKMGSDKAKLTKLLRGQAGLYAYFGTSDARKVEAMADAGDKLAALVYEAMALSVAKSVAKLAVVVNGKVDAIILSGGLVYSERLSGWIRERVAFIAPVVLMPGENEMEALALGALRVLRGEEVPKLFTGWEKSPGEPPSLFPIVR